MKLITCKSRMRRAICLSLFLFAHTLAHAEDNAVDTEFIFGFTTGADVGEPGEKELENEVTESSGKRTGSYIAVTNDFRFEETPIEGLRLELGLPVDYYNITGVTGLDDRTQMSVAGIDAAVRYKLLDRGEAPFSLTIGAEPHWSRVDDESGAPVRNYGAEFSLAIDAAPVPQGVFAALNVVYDPEWTRLRDTASWERAATLGVLSSVSARIQPSVFVGLESRYFLESQGLGPGRFTGRAWYVGPTMFYGLTPKMAISGAFAYQVWGHSRGISGALDLTSFSRCEAILRLEYNF